MLKKILCLAAATLYLNTITCQAAIPDAGADLKRFNNVGEYYKKEKELYQEKAVPDKDDVVNKAEQEIKNNPQDNVVISISKITVDKSAILSDEEVREITKKYEGLELGLKDLYKAVNDINELYKNKSYISAKAVLPPQKIEEGVVRIQLVEGRFGDFLIEGNKYTRNAYITDRISSNSGDLVKLDQLQKDIFYFNNTNDVRLKAELRPGKKFGTTDCILKLEEPNEWQSTIFSDNAGRSESGLYRMGMVIANNSVFGNREALVISPTWTKGTVAGSVSYTAPVGNYGARIGVSYSKNQIDIISGPFESMEIAGDSSDVGINVTQPITVEAKRKVEGYAEMHWKDSSTDFFGNTLLDTKVKTITLGSNMRIMDDKGLWYNQYSVTRVAADKKDAYSGKVFSRFNLSAIRQQLLDSERTLIWRFSGQVTSDHELPSSEQFSLGGMSTVKGYVEGLLSGDQGYYAGIEYNFPLQFSKKMKGLVFVDHGSTYNGYNNGTHSKEFLTSTGLGIMMNYSPDFFGKIIIGFPVASSKEHDKSRIHFFLQSNIK